MNTSERSGIRPSPALNVHVKAVEMLPASPPLSARRRLRGGRPDPWPDHGFHVRYKNGQREEAMHHENPRFIPADCPVSLRRSRHLGLRRPGPDQESDLGLRRTERER